MYRISTVILAATAVVLLLGCEGDSESAPTPESYTTVKYDYVWPSTSSLDGYKIRFTDTTLNKDHRKFLEFLQDGYSHAFVYDFTQYQGTDSYEIYGYEQDNPKYSSDYYIVNGLTTIDNKETIALTTYYFYRDASGIDIRGRDECDLYPTSATGGTYMCWGEYPVGTSLYDAKTGKYELVVDPTAP